jgi:EF-P beta-lysylation protein EpmB
MPDAVLPAPPTPRLGDRDAPRWRRELAEAIRDAGELRRVLGLPAAVDAPADQGFPVLVPRGFAARMRRGDPDDPLLLQVLPRAAEAADVAGFTADPVGESAALAGPGLVRKYSGRALVLVTGACAVHCRYCFRREFSYADAGATSGGVESALEAIAADESLTEVILSGGDPLLADDPRLADIVGRLEAIGHVRRLRIHTRLPVVLPSRVTDRLAGILGGSRLAVVMVIHANHAAEIDAEVAAALRRLAEARCLLLNQAVLLAGVNDSVADLRTLSERLVDVGVMPYYLHLLDRVRGAAHFEVSEPRARELHRALRDSLPGYAVPRLVREVPGEPAKSWLA